MLVFRAVYDSSRHRVPLGGWSDLGMNPRLDVDPMTEEDFNAWCELVPSLRVFGEYGLLLRSRQSDMRDGELMWHLASAYGDIRGWQRSYPGVWHAACAFQGIAIPADFDRNRFNIA
jgi:hypothetical protein